MLLLKELATKKLAPGGGQRAHRVGVVLDAVAEALVGQVEVGDQLALDRAAGSARPTARGVRSTPVGLWQQACSSTTLPAGSCVQRLQHLGEAHAAVGGVVVRVGVHGDAGAFEHRAVVVPGRVADPDLAVREPALDEVGADLQPAATSPPTGSWPRACDASASCAGAEQQLLHRLAEVGRALDRQVGLRPALRDDARLGAAAPSAAPGCGPARRSRCRSTG